MATEDFTPSLSDIGAVLRARTRDENGNELGTFTEGTRPTDDEVDALIPSAVAEVLLHIPDDEVSDRLIGYAKYLVSLRVGMAIELSYNPDQTAEGSAYARLKELFDAGTTAFLAAADIARVDDTPEAPAIF